MPAVIAERVPQKEPIVACGTVLRHCPPMWRLVRKRPAPWFDKLRSLLLAVFVFASVALWASPAAALFYLDPGVGSMIVQGLVGVVAGGLIAVKLCWARIKQVFGAKRDARSIESRTPDRD